MITTTCPNCKQTYEAEESYIGEIAECECGNKWIIYPPLKKQNIDCLEDINVNHSAPIKRNEEVSPATLEDDSFNVWGFLLRCVFFSIGIFIIIYGIKIMCNHTNDNNGSLGVGAVFIGIIFVLCSFVSLKPKIKRFFFICPNPNCRFQGEIQYNPDEGVLKGTGCVLLLSLIGIRTILYNAPPTVTCPKCGMIVQHSRE